MKSAAQKKWTWFLPLVAAVLLLAAWFRFRSSSLDTPPPPPATGDSATAVTTDPAAIFRRAFWRQPTAADHILHAERRETKDPATGEITAWQWWLALEPGPDLLRALRDPATFDLAPSTVADLSAAASPAPAWFPSAAKLPASAEIHRSPSGTFTVIYLATENRLYATDAGRGFAAPQKP